MSLCIQLSKTFSSSSSIPQDLSKTLSLQNLLKSGFTPTLKSFNHFLLFLSKSHKLSFLLHFFSQMNSNNITPNSQTHSIVAKTLVKAKKFEEAEQYITQIPKDGVFPLNGVWDSLIQGFCSPGETPEKAFSVLLDCLKLHGVLPSRFTFCLLIQSFSSLGHMDRAIEVLELMTGENLKYPFDNFVCSSVISGFCKIGKPELALGFYDNVEKIGALGRTNVVTYTAIVSALCKEGRVKEVCDLVHKMEHDGVVLDAVFYSSWICGYFENGVLEEAFRKHREMLGKGIKPDTVSYTILIDGFSKEGNVEKAVGFLNEMRKGGLQPNLVTYTAVMRGFCKRGKLEEAFTMFKRVEDLGIEMDEVTYSTIIDGLCRVGDFDRVFLLLEEMEKKGVSIGIITYNTVINGLCKVGRTTEAGVMSNNILGDNFTYSSLLRGYVRENNAAGIFETKKRIEEARIHMDVVMCNVLIKALFMVGAFDDAHMVFKGMPEMGLLADSDTYFSMIDGYCKTGRIEEALEIFDSCRGTFSIANVRCYSYIIRVLCGNDTIDMAIDVFLELVGNALVPEEATYIVLLRSIFDERNAEGILEFVMGFEKLEDQIFRFISNGAVHFLCKQGSPYTAFDIYSMMRKKGIDVTSKSYYSILKGLVTDNIKMLIPVMLNAYIKEYGLHEAKVNKIMVMYLCEKDMNKAIYLLNKMKDKNLRVGIPIAAVEALTQQGRALDAYKLVLKARVNDPSSDIVAYTMVIDGLCKEGHLHKALDLCHSMRNKGVAPNIITYNTVIHGLCRQGCLVQALRLFDSLERINLAPTDITYGTLISALCNEGYLQDAQQFLDKMVIDGLTPHTHIYNSLVHGYCKFGYLNEALEIINSWESSFCKPDAFTVSSVLYGFCREGDMEGARTFYFEYKRRNILPDFFGFMYLIKGLCVKGWMEEARSIIGEMLDIQSIVELINRAGDEIETESPTSIVVSLLEQGNVEQATSVLDEVGSWALSSWKRYSGATSMKNPNNKGVLSMSSSKSLSPHPGSLSVGQSEVLKESSRLENSENSSCQPRLYDFNAYYSRIASLCSEGKLNKANQVAKEMLLIVTKCH